MIRLALATFLAWSTVAEASDRPPGLDVQRMLAGMLPKGWTLVKERLPPGVLGAAEGPARGGAGAVVVVSRVERGNDEEWAKLEARWLGSEAEVVSQGAGPLGGPELVLRRSIEGTRWLVRHLIVRDGARDYLISIVAPEAEASGLYKLVVNAATEVRELRRAGGQASTAAK